MNEQEVSPHDLIFRSIDEIEQAHQAIADNQLFSNLWRCWLQTEIHDKVYGERFFIVSQQFDPEQPRIYDVRSAIPVDSDSLAQPYGHFLSFDEAENVAMLLGELDRKSRRDTQE